jgi:3-methyladenine DNA glycosylase AlkD
MASKKAAVKKAGSKAIVSKGAQAAPRMKEVLARLEALAMPKIREEMGTRYGIHTADRVLGIAVGTLQQVAKEIGKDHALALALWETGCYEARMLASFVDEVEKITPAQMDAWCNAFDNWGICDTVCFKLFDQT